MESKCAVEGNPPPGSEWLKDGQKIDPGLPMRREDSGIYILKAEGSFFIQREIQVLVLGECNIHFFNERTTTVIPEVKRSSIVVHL